MSKNLKRKYKRPKQKTLATTNPETSTSLVRRQDSETRVQKPLCPLLAKDSEWADVLQHNPHSSQNISGEEEVLQLVECEEGPEMKPLAIMFPGLLDEDPQTLQGILDKAMSTTDVTKHLVDLGQKANFTFMKKADRLIPPEKQWLESVTESSNSFSSITSLLPNEGVSKNNVILEDSDSEGTCVNNTIHKRRSERIYNDCQDLVNKGNLKYDGHQ